MSKSDAKLKNIDLSLAYKDQRNAKWADNKQINAFDTETIEGNVFMLSYAIGDWNGLVHNNKVKSMKPGKIWEKITHRECRNALNVWYNLDFDANAILSDILTTNELVELVVTNGTETEYNGMEYEIRYVKGKFLRISDEHRNNYNHYDIGQFFYAPLDNAAEEWLGENKIEEVDTSKFGRTECDKHEQVEEDCSDCWTYKQARNYILDNYSLIKEYAVKDATLTQRLGKALVEQAEELKIPMGMPISTGFLSAEFLRANTFSKPSFGMRKYQSMFWDSYYGGRFEVFKRGNVGEIAAPDINSAYPAVMRKLPDPNTLNWKHYANDPEDTFKDFHSKQFKFEDVAQADYGVVRAIVTTKPDNPIQPFAKKVNGKVMYPILTDTEITVIKPIFVHAVENGLLHDFELKEAWLGNECDETTFPFQFIEDMYAQRKTFENEGIMKKGQLLKIVLNSLYGKTCQTTEYKEIMDNTELIDLSDSPHKSIYPKDHLSPNWRKELQNDDVIVRSLTAGRRFNPFFASYITGMTRLELHKQVVKYDLVGNTVMFATDCIMVEKDAYDNSDFSELIKPGLGFWDYDYEGSAFIVGSGVYEVEFDECQKNSCDDEQCENIVHRTKTKTRGFLEKTIDKTLKNMAQKYPMGIPLDNRRPLTIAEVLISPERGNVSQFVADSKRMLPDFDTKRYWERESPTFHDLLDSSEESQPIDLLSEQEKKMVKWQEEKGNESIEVINEATAYVND